MAALTAHKGLTLKPTSSVKCEALLENVRQALGSKIHAYTTSYFVTFQVGVYKEIQKLLLASGADRSTAVQAAKFIEQTLEKNRNRDTVLGTTLKYLERVRTNDEALLICVTTEPCHLTEGTLFIPDQSELSLAQFNSDDFQAPPGKRIPNLILMNGGAAPYMWQGILSPSNAVALAWAIDFLTAATSFADYELVKDWIAANTALLKANQRSDELFEHYATIVPELKVDIGFFRALSSSRATAATLAVVPNGPSEGLRTQTMGEIRTHAEDTRNIVSRYNLSEQNIVEFGERITKQMLETIRRAEKLTKN